MLEDRTLRVLSAVTLAAAVVACMAMLFGGMPLSWSFAFPIQIGLIFCGASLMFERNRPGRSWNRSPPRGLAWPTLVVCAVGAAMAIFGFGTLASMQVTGSAVHSLNAYVDQGTCWAVINKAAPIQEQALF